MNEKRLWGRVVMLGASGLMLAMASVRSAATGTGTPSDVPMSRPGDCLAVLDGIAHHASWAEAPDGSLLMVWGGITFPTLFANSRDGGLTWSKPREAREVSGQVLSGHDTNSLIRLADGAIGFVNRTRNQSKEPDHLLFWRSEDGGNTWQKPVRIGPKVDHEVTCIHDGLTRTSSGRIVLPVYGRMELANDPLARRTEIGAFLHNQWMRIAVHENDSRFSWSYVFYSDDEGRTWQTSRSGNLVVWDPERMTWHRTSQPSVAEVAPGKLLMLLRTDLGRLYQSWSNDNGDTWTLPRPSSLASPLFPAQLRTIPGTGDLLVVWTQTSEEEIRKGLGRGRLSSAISRKHGGQGALWEFYQNIESILEGTRVEPGPIRFTRPEGVFYDQGQAAPQRQPQYVVNLPDNYASMACPSVFFYKDRVLIANAYEGQYRPDGSHVYGRLKVLPISWLYGGVTGLQSNKFGEELRKRFPQK